MLDPHRDEFKVGHAGPGEPALENHALLAIRKGRVEEEVSEAVGDNPAMIPLDRLRDVWMMAEDQVGAQSKTTENT